ncbi:MAG: hypothetical protein R6W06_00560 [Prochlorococcaceae cyanobacterium]
MPLDAVMLAMGSHSRLWVNTPVLVEAMQRYEQGRLPRSLQLWLQTLLELDEAPSVPLLALGDRPHPLG